MLTKSLSYLLGVLRDGCLSKSGQKTEVTLATDLSRDWLNVIAQLASVEFSIPESRFKIYEVWGKKSKQSCYRLKIYSKAVFDLLLNHYRESAQLHWCTPPIVREASLELQKEYLAGFYDAEGGCRNVENYLSGKTKSIQCWASIRCKHDGFNEPLEFAKRIFNEVGIKSSVYDSDELVITGRKNLRLFYETFPLKHGRKKNDVKNLLIFERALSADA